MKGSPLAVSLAVPRDDPAGGPSPVGGRGGGPMRGGADRYGTLSPQYGVCSFI